MHRLRPNPFITHTVAGFVAGAAASQPILEDQALVPSTLIEESGFGVSADSRGDTAVVGANIRGTAASPAGAAFVYNYVDGKWFEHQTLTPSNGVAGDQFGRRVAVGESSIFVAAPTGGIGQGQVYVFELEDDMWVERQILVASDGQAGRPFGVSIDVAGGVLVIGDDRAPGGGAVYIFEYDGSQWIETVKLTPSGNDSGDRYGNSAATNGQSVMVGAPGDDDTGRQSGAIYVYQNDGTGWNLSEKLYSANPNQDNNLGDALAMHGDYAMASTPGDAGSVGIVDCFRFEDPGWVSDGIIIEQPMPTNGRFGESIAILHNRAVIGRLEAKFPQGPGSAFVYTRTKQGWTLEDQLVSSTGAEADVFGRSVTVSTHGIIVGANGDDDAGLSSGAAFAYYIMTRSDCLADTDQDGKLTMDDFNAWFMAYNKQLPWCDQNNDGSCTPTDFTAWVGNYNAGCP